MRLVNRFTAPQTRKCEMCGGIVDIRNCYELENQRSKERVLCGRNCIVKYAIVLKRLGQTPCIVFPSQFRADAVEVNEIRPNTVIVEAVFEADEENWSLSDLIGQRVGADETDCGDVLADGLDPDEIDWDSCDYE